MHCASPVPASSIVRISVLSQLLVWTRSHKLNQLSTATILYSIVLTSASALLVARQPRNFSCPATVLTVCRWGSAPSVEWPLGNLRLQSVDSQSVRCSTIRSRHIRQLAVSQEPSLESRKFTPCCQFGTDRDPLVRRTVYIHCVLHSYCTTVTDSTA